MNGKVRGTGESGTHVLPPRRMLVAAARCVLWGLLRDRERVLQTTRGALRRRLGEFLRRAAAGRLAAILRSAALAAAAAAALLGPSPARAQAIELADIARGEGGFVARIEGEPASGAGASVADAGDVNGDGIPDLIIGESHYCYPSVCRSAPTYVVFGKPGGEAVELAEVQAGRGGFVIRGVAASYSSGGSVSGAGDVNGDGLADLLVGGPRASPQRLAGETYVVFGKAGGEAVELGDVQVGRGGFAIRGSAPSDDSGFIVSGAGDVNGDGLADLLVGAPDASPGGRRGAGESYVAFGKRGGEAVELSEIQAGRGGFAIRGVAAGDRSGYSVSEAGDVNGDGLADLLVGGPRASPQRLAGETYVVFGKPGGEAVELGDVQVGRGGFAIRGSAPSDDSGFIVSGAGDVNGDGLADLLVGAPDASPGGRYRAGESYVVFGKPGGQTVYLSEIQAGRGGFAIQGSGDGDYSGASVSGAGDVNGDGLADLLVGAVGVDSGGRDYAGASYVVFGKAGGEAVALEPGRGGFAIRGVEAGDRSGASVSGAGDVNGDGLADLLVGAPGADPGGRRGAGESYVVFGKAGGEAVLLWEIQAGQGAFAIQGSGEGDYSGLSVSGAGDVDGDGFADLVIAAGLADARYPRLSGAAYVVFGPTAPPPPRFRRGAVGGEETLNLSDAIHLLNHLYLGGDVPPCLDAADTDDSGGLNLTDAVKVLNYLFLGGAAPPDPGPTTCGSDPTEDKLGCATPTRGCAP